MPVYESHLEAAALNWFAELGYQKLSGYDIAPAPDGSTPERANYRQVILVDRLRERLRCINPTIPAAAIEDAIQHILNPNLPSLLQANRQFHRWLRDGVKVEYQSDKWGDGETVGDYVRLLDFDNPDNNDWAAINQFTIKGPHHTKRPDILVFVNGLPLAVLELKNPGNEKTDIWEAFDQLQTYKEQIPDLFVTNELLVIADGMTARVGVLTADKEWFMQWRTIDGEKLDPLGQFREAETLIRGLFQRDLLLDFVRNCILCEDDGGIVKKVAGYHQFHAVRKATRATIRAAAPVGDRKIGVVWHTQGSGKSISMCFYALETNEASVRELGDDALRKIAVELTESLRRNVSIDWSVRDTIRAQLRLMVKRILRKYKYPPDLEQRAIDLVLQQAETLSEAWAA